MLRIVTLGTLVAYWAAIFVGTHTPDGVRGLGRIYDKFLHFGAYAGLAFLLAVAFTTLRLRQGALWLPLAVASIYGCIDEVSQIAVPGRRAEVADWAADVFGAGFGVFVFGLLSLCIVKFYARPATLECNAVTNSAA